MFESIALVKQNPDKEAGSDAGVGQESAALTDEEFVEDEVEGVKLRFPGRKSQPLTMAAHAINGKIRLISSPLKFPHPDLSLTVDTRIGHCVRKDTDLI